MSPGPGPVRFGFGWPLVVRLQPQPNPAAAFGGSIDAASPVSLLVRSASTRRPGQPAAQPLLRAIANIARRLHRRDATPSNLIVRVAKRDALAPRASHPNRELDSRKARMFHFHRKLYVMS